MTDADSLFTHGGPDALGAPAHDFSTNANACGPSPGAMELVSAADLSRYPDPAYTALREQLAAMHGVDARRIVLAAGASEFIRRITTWVALENRNGHGEAALPAMSYGDYAASARALGLQVVRAPHAARRPWLAWCCDPSAPLGQAQQGIGETVDALPEGVPCVLDRAYEPLRLEGRLALNQRQLDRVWQMWSPNKALGMTGVRAAYAIAPADAQDAVRTLLRLAASWPVGADGVAMLSAWTQPGVQQWLSDSLVTLRAWKASQTALCSEMGWQVWPSDANFHVAKPSADDFAGLLKRLRAAGIKLRDCTSFGLPGHVRMGVLPPASQHALKEAWTGAA
ncbi:aminotransferase class I/II-fold pyridoxal phosphate-dependent enzyme [Variovorax sp. 278MFTsu5.1]|uniref:aminotransferase class I/II-fold pyridoxal phosphate-dependent enzyme n=1 Tax=Variovorax sp. 278MFTsu5.1 TaxID=3158366 RepID=UPI003AAC0F67